MSVNAQIPIFQVSCKLLISLGRGVCVPGNCRVVPGYPKSLKNHKSRVCVSPVIYIYTGRRPLGAAAAFCNEGQSRHLRTASTGSHFMDGSA
jgi:hypothetical protein